MSDNRQELLDHLLGWFGVPAHIFDPRLPPPARPDAEALLDACAESPEDWPRYLVAADAHEEAGDLQAAECLRWAAREERAPLYGRWYSAQAYQNSRLSADLPSAIHKHMSSDRPYAGFDSDRAALDALIAAWRETIADGWRPEGEVTP